MDHRNTPLGRKLANLSYAMCLAATLTFLVPGFVMLCSVGGDAIFGAMRCMADIAFYVAAIFAGGTMLLVGLWPYQVFVTSDEDQRDGLHVQVIVLVLVFFTLIFLAANLRWKLIAAITFGSIHANHIVSSIVIASVLVTIDVCLIIAARKGRLRAEWFSFAAEAVKLDVGVWIVFALSGVFLLCTINQVPPQNMHELATLIAGIEAALLTVSTFAFALDSGGLLKLSKSTSSPEIAVEAQPLPPAAAIEGTVKA